MIPLPLAGLDAARDLAEDALVVAYPICARADARRRRWTSTDAAGPRPSTAPDLVRWAATVAVLNLMELDPVGAEAEAALGRAEVRLDWEGWDRARVQSWLEDVRAVAAAHARFGAQA